MLTALAHAATARRRQKTLAKRCLNILKTNQMYEHILNNPQNNKMVRNRSEATLETVLSSGNEKRIMDMVLELLSRSGTRSGIKPNTRSTRTRPVGQNADRHQKRNKQQELKNTSTTTSLRRQPKA